MKRTALLLILIALCTMLVAEIYQYQGFEDSSSDTWNYTANPNPSRLNYWGLGNTNVGNAAPYNGKWYWVSWDLDNIPSSLTFENVALPGGYSYALSFYYFTEGLNTETDYSRYCISSDGGITWSVWEYLLPNTNAWTLVNVNLPVYTTQVMLKVEARHDGKNKFAHWDHILLERYSVDPAPPLVYDLSAAQRTDGSGLVDIHYSLFDTNNDTCTISIMLADGIDAAYNFSPSPANLSGDIGSNIAMGINKQIIWDAKAEGIAFNNSHYRIKVIADDGTTYGTVSIPGFNPGAGTYTTTQNVTLSCATEAAVIRYTTNGSDPNETSAIYTSPIAISTNTILKAKAYKNLWNPSGIAVAEYIVNAPPTYFVLVPGGTFTMGDTRGNRESDEIPTHSVTLSSFYMGKYEVTQSEWAAIMGTNPASGYGVGNNHPVYNVSWYSLLKYCNLRSMAEQLTPAYTINGSTNPSNWGSVPTYNSSTWDLAICNWSADGYRLPTEAEWEYAARGATNTPDYMYCGSENINEVAWYEANNSPYGCKPVGTKVPNGLGLYDMSGNLYEWCWDWYGNTYYSSSPTNNPTGPESNYSRVERGGRWYSIATGCRVTNRGNDYPSFSGNYVGFRLCKTAR